MIGLAFSGVSISFIATPIFPELIEAIEHDEILEEFFDEEYLEDFIATKLQQIRALCFSAGPIIGAWAVSLKGFENTFYYLSLFIGLNCIVYSLCCFTCNLKVTKERKTNNIELVNHN